jgi:hypothetical protein
MQPTQATHIRNLSAVGPFGRSLANTEVGGGLRVKLKRQERQERQTRHLSVSPLASLANLALLAFLSELLDLAGAANSRSDC